MPITHQKDWTSSTKGNPIEIFSNTNLKAGHKISLLFIGGVHGDEPEGVVLARALLNHLVDRPHNEDSPKWAVIPCLNPDGFIKNSRTNGNNVDLNRNYPSSNWSKEYSKKRYFPGKSPNTEPETKALVELINKNEPELIIHFHSWKPCIVCAGEKALEYGKYLSECSGYELKANIGYPTPGSLSDYAWGDLKIPVICIEEKESEDPEKIWPHFAEGLKKIIYEFRN